MATIAPSKSTARFYKAAVAQGVMSEADARRCMAAIAKAGRPLDPAKVAVKLGALTPEVAEQVKAGLTAARGAKAPAPTAPRRDGRRTLLLVGGALLAGTLTGIAAVVAMNDPVAEVEVAVEPPPAPAPTTPTPPAREDAARASRLETALALTLRSARDLAEAGRERAALEIVDEFVATQGEAPAASKERARLLARCEDLLTDASRRLRDAAREGHDGAADVRRLRDRLPASFAARVDALALELRATPREAVPAPSWKEDVLVAAAPVARAEEQVEQVVDASSGEAQDAEDEEQVVLADDMFDPSRGAGSFGPRAGEGSTGSTGSGDAGDDDLPPDVGAPGAGPAVDTTSPVALALRDLLHVSHVLSDGKVDARYDFSEQGQEADFQMVGFDKAEINRVNGSHAYSTDFELGAGSRGLGRLAHVLPLAGDVQVEFTIWLNHSTTRSNLVFMLGNNVGVRWGQQLVKVSRSGAMRPLTRGEPDRTIFREERKVTVKLTRVGETLTVECNGRRVAQKTFKAGELDGRFGLIASDLRLIVTDLRITGVVDAAGL